MQIIQISAAFEMQVTLSSTFASLMLPGTILYPYGTRIILDTIAATHVPTGLSRSSDEIEVLDASAPSVSLLSFLEKNYCISLAILILYCSVS